MLIQSGDIIRMTLTMQGSDGQVFQNVFHSQPVGLITPVDGDDFKLGVLPVLEAMYQNIQALITNNLNFISVDFYNVTQDLPFGESAWAGISSGSATGDELPAQVSPMVNFTTDAKRSTGRKFIAGVVESACDAAGKVGSAAQIALANYAGSALLGWVAGGENFVFGNWQKAAGTFAPWTGAIIDSIFSSQRRRKQGTGV